MTRVPLVSDGGLFVYPRDKPHSLLEWQRTSWFQTVDNLFTGKPHSLLAKFIQKDINTSGGVTMTFDNSIAKGRAKLERTETCHPSLLYFPAERSVGLNS